MEDRLLDVKQPRPINDSNEKDFKFGTIYLIRNDFYLNFECAFCGNQYNSIKEFLKDSLEHINEKTWSDSSSILLERALKDIHQIETLSIVNKTINLDTSCHQKFDLVHDNPLMERILDVKEDYPYQSECKPNKEKKNSHGRSKLSEAGPQSEYFCSECNKKFNTKNAWRVHNYRKHSEKNKKLPKESSINAFKSNDNSCKTKSFLNEAVQINLDVKTNTDLELHGLAEPTRNPFLHVTSDMETLEDDIKPLKAQFYDVNFLESLNKNSDYIQFLEHTNEEEIFKNIVNLDDIVLEEKIDTDDASVNDCGDRGCGDGGCANYDLLKIDRESDIYCSNCCKNFLNKIDFNQHKCHLSKDIIGKESHLKDESFQLKHCKKHFCVECNNKIFNSKSALNMHNKRNHTPEALLKKKLMGPRKLKRSANKSPLRKFYCYECKKLFDCKMSLRRHYEKMHSIEDNFNETKQIPETNDDYYGDDVDNDDVKSENNESETEDEAEADDEVEPNEDRDAEDNEEFGCSFCTKTFNRKSSLNRHLNTVHASPEVIAQRKQLALEKRKNNHERPYGCNVCGKRFYARKVLKEHLVSHSGLRPFQCNECNKTFTWKKSLKQHKKLHSDEYSYQCQYCEKSFQQAPGLCRHIKSVHKDAEIFNSTDFNTNCI